MKNPSKPVHKSIGQIFVKYNLVEYKPPGESKFVELMNFIVNINQKYFQGREKDMCQALMEIVRDEIEKEKKEAVEKAVEQARPFIIRDAEPEIIRKSNMRLAKALKDCLDDEKIAMKLDLPLEVVQRL